MDFNNHVLIFHWLDEGPDESRKWEYFDVEGNRWEHIKNPTARAILAIWPPTYERDGYKRYEIPLEDFQTIMSQVVTGEGTWA